MTTGPVATARPRPPMPRQRGEGDALGHRQLAGGERAAALVRMRAVGGEIGKVVDQIDGGRHEREREEGHSRRNQPRRIIHAPTGDGRHEDQRVLDPVHRAAGADHVADLGGLVRRSDVVELHAAAPQVGERASARSRPAAVRRWPLQTAGCRLWSRRDRRRALTQ